MLPELLILPMHLMIWVFVACALFKVRDRECRSISPPLRFPVVISSMEGPAVVESGVTQGARDVFHHLFPRIVLKDLRRGEFLPFFPKVFVHHPSGVCRFGDPRFLMGSGQHDQRGETFGDHADRIP